jgi:hypothetical protein
MARGSTLGTMLTMLRAEARMATDSSVGQSKNPALRVLLKRVYAMLYDEHTWPHLSGQWGDKSIVAGSRYYDFPSEVNMEGAVSAYYQWNGVWLPLTAGFDTTAYNEFDSDDDERSDPVQAWRIYSGTQFEVWPMPSVDGTVRFVGKAAMGAFESDMDVCLLDDHLVVLFAAAELVADKPELSAPLKASAERRLAQVKGLMNKSEPFQIGSTDASRRRSFGTSVIAVR